ncbi:MAG: hypothetical protein KJO82_02120 [Gammaproteobacteria bacterium]|nr:hypothetical protein [Gammaproteobacteria bacterium]
MRSFAHLHAGKTFAVLALLRTLFDITLLRKGPEVIPHSPLVLLLTIVFWCIASLSALLLIERVDITDLRLDVVSTIVAIVVYSSIVVLSGFTPRLMQTLSAVIGCGAIVRFVFVCSYALTRPFVGDTFIGLLAWGVLLWSISVKGHIIARAVDRHWYFGLLIAVTVFVLQRLVDVWITAPP